MSAPKCGHSVFISLYLLWQLSCYQKGNIQERRDETYSFREFQLKLDIEN